MEPTDRRLNAARVVRLDVEYDGTDFRGFAPQPAARTVGGVLATAIARIVGEPVRLSPGGRTDTGVHARGQVVSFRTVSDRPTDVIHRAANALLDEDVRVLRAVDADCDFDARRSARRRRYRYRIWNDPRPNLWERRWTAHVPEELDVEAMQVACQALVGRHDFAAFRTHQAQDDQAITTTRRVYEAFWQRSREQPVVEFSIEADAYLRHMVRVIVGSAIKVGVGREPVGSLQTMLERGCRAAAGPTAPPQGLTLMQVIYPDE